MITPWMHCMYDHIYAYLCLLGKQIIEKPSSVPFLWRCGRWHWCSLNAFHESWVKLISSFTEIYQAWMEILNESWNLSKPFFIKHGMKNITKSSIYQANMSISFLWTECPLMGITSSVDKSQILQQGLSDCQPHNLPRDEVLACPRKLVKGERISGWCHPIISPFISRWNFTHSSDHHWSSPTQPGHPSVDN